MKSLVSFFAILLLAFPACAQTDSHTWSQFLVQLEALELKYNTHYPAKAYPQAEAVLNDMVRMLDHLTLPEKEKTELAPRIRTLKANIYYNLSCVQSLQQHKKPALASFEKAIYWGYTEYQHIKTDTDLDPIRKEKKFIALLDQLKQYDMLVLLQQSGSYQDDHKDSLPGFNYQVAGHHNLKAVKAYFNLDSVAGKGDEVSKLVNIMLFVSRSIKYDGSNWALCEFDAIDFYNYYKTTGKGINCRHMAMTLNEMYLAMGFKSRFVTCMPKDRNDPDCHVINCVYSETLNKWLWMDASHGIYVMDEHNNMLSIEEVRTRLRNNQPLQLNKETGRTKDWYLDYYMAKNLYWIQCTNQSRFNTESRYRPADKDLRYIALTPTGYDEQNPYLKGNTITHNPVYFWQRPETDKAID